MKFCSKQTFGQILMFNFATIMIKKGKVRRKIRILFVVTAQLPLRIMPFP